MAYIKVEGGTAKGGQNLCAQCRWFKRVEFSAGTKFFYCSEFNKRLYGPVYECTEYDYKQLPTLYEMKELAWVIIPGKAHLGFRKASRLTGQEKREYESEV